MSYWLITAIALAGVILNIEHDQRCFFIWFATNAAFAIRTYMLGAYEMTLLFTIYWVLAIVGIYRWRANPHESLVEENQKLREENHLLRSTQTSRVVESIITDGVGHDKEVPR